MGVIFGILFLFAICKTYKAKEVDCVYWGILALLCGTLASYFFWN